VRTLLKCARLWGRNQNPTFIGRERDEVLRGYYRDRSFEQASWAMGHAQGRVEARGWLMGLLGLDQWAEDKGKE